MSDNDNDNEQQRKEKNIVLRDLRQLRDLVDGLFERAKLLWWLPREYEGKLLFYTPVQTDLSYKHIETDPNNIVVPEELATFKFGAVFLEPGSHPDIPETRRERYAIEHPFNVKRFVINDEDAPHFVVESLQIGQFAPFGIAQKIPATRFADSGKPIDINHYASEGLEAFVQVRNVSKEPRMFRSKLIGIESSSESSTS